MGLNYKFVLHDETLRLYQVLVSSSNKTIATAMFNTFYGKPQLEFASEPTIEKILFSE